LGYEKTKKTEPGQMHSTLARQLRKAKHRSPSGDVDYQRLLEMVNETYEQMDKERRLTSRSIAIASDELFELNQTLKKEMDRSERLLLNILPEPVAKELKEHPGDIIAEAYDCVSILFTDFKGFTAISSHISAGRLVKELNDIFGYFDAISPRYHMEKVKTIGDAYMVAGGIPTRNSTHAADAIRMAFDIISFIDARLKRPECLPLSIRVGIHSGPVVAGVIGKSKFAYDLWGDSVNIASRMESNGEPGHVNVSKRTRELAGEGFRWTYRGAISVKGGGEQPMYFVDPL
jgi:adenylate cyclase